MGVVMFSRVVTSIFCLFLSSSCAFASFENEYFEFFQEAYKRKCLVMPIDAYFARLEPNIAGYCIPGFGILLNENMWPMLSKMERKELMFHELGHCVLGLEHSKEGMMAPVMHDEQEIEKNWDKWVEELFSVCRK
jgi:hypothetical protein